MLTMRKTKAFSPLDIGIPNWHPEHSLAYRPERNLSCHPECSLPCHPERSRGVWLHVGDHQRPGPDVSTALCPSPPLRAKRCARHDKRRATAFTLIELLAVIAIMALLMAILLPTLQRVRKQTKATACQANLHQWGLILDAYTNDNDDRFFRGMVDGWWNDWIEILEPFYGKIGGLTCCPLATKTPDKGGQGVFAAWKDPEGDYGSYGLSAWVCNADPGAVFGDGLYWRTPTVKSAQNITVFLDSRGIAGWPDHTSLPPADNGQPPQGITLTEQMKNFCIDRHGNGMTNCLFMDWSVRKVALKELWTLKWHRQFDTAGPWTKAGGVKPEDWPKWMRHFKDY